MMFQRQIIIIIILTKYQQWNLYKLYNSKSLSCEAIQNCKAKPNDSQLMTYRTGPWYDLNLKPANPYQSMHSFNAGSGIPLPIQT